MKMDPRLKKLATALEDSGSHDYGGGGSHQKIQSWLYDNGKVISCSEDEDIEARQHLITEQLGFKMSDHSMQIYGICKNCQN